MTLNQQIDQIRNRMIKVGMAKGFSNQWTVALSEQLDDYIVEEQKGRMNR